METIQPIPKTLYDQLVAAGVESFYLEFSGGSDEGYLGISFNPWTNDLESAIEEWAWSAYSYSGDGDGSNYGDDITYDLKNKTASCSEWSMIRQYGQTDEEPLQIE